MKGACVLLARRLPTRPEVERRFIPGRLRNPVLIRLPVRSFCDLRSDELKVELLLHGLQACRDLRQYLRIV